MDYQKRRAALVKEMAASGQAALVVTAYENRRYYSGFSGSFGFLVVMADQTILLTDGRYREQAKAEAPDIDLAIVGGMTAASKLADVLKAVGQQAIGFDGRLASYPTYQMLVGLFGRDRLVDLSQLIDAQRSIKDAEELALIGQAEAIGDAAFSLACEKMTAGMTEVDVALILESEMRRQGAQGTSFDTIVASGARGALPHGLASLKPLEKGDMVVMDFGCRYQGYCSDMTRTVAIGEPTDTLKDLYSLVLKAQKACLRAARAGVIGADIHQVAVDTFKEAGMDQYFGHGLGHSLGLEIHEKPVFSTGEKKTLAENVVITVEPGLYLPGQGGVRIEDVIVLTEDGHKNLTSSPKELLIL